MIDWEAFKSQIQQNPRKMLGFILVIAVCFLLIWMLAMLQTDSAGQTVAVAPDGRLDSIRLSLNGPATDSLAVPQQEANEASSSQPASPFTRALPIFLIMLAAIGGLWYWIKKSNNGSAMPPRTSSGLFSSVGSQPLSGGHQLEVIKINNEYWVLSTNENNVQLLHRFPQDEWNGPAVSPLPQEQEKSTVFETILQMKRSKELSEENGAAK